MDIQEITKDVKNLKVFEALIKADNIINRAEYKTILCSISGGADSDIVLDICHKVDRDKKIKYVWFNTGLEYEATKNHLNYLEEKYNIKIERERAIQPIPLTCKKSGQPFLNKYVSNIINRLQKVDFKWEDRPYEELLKEYPTQASAIKWWCNKYTEINGFEKVSRFDIGYNKWLKEFMIQNPPAFAIDNKCCKYAKKDVGHVLEKKYDADLSIIGVRQLEGGIRALAYKNCFSNNDDGIDQFRPVFWFSDDDKKYYEDFFEVIHSDCYTKYGFKRTGCAGCPYNRELDQDMKITKKFEPKLYNAMNNIFRDSYEYTKKYREFYNEMERKNKQMDGQISLFDYEEE